MNVLSSNESRVTSVRCGGSWAASARQPWRSRLQQIGIALCGLSLGLFGCPQGESGVDGGSEIDVPGEAGGGGDGGSGGGDSGGGGGGGSGGGSGVLDRSAIVRPDAPTLFVADLDEGVASFANAHVLNGNVAPTTFFDTRLRFIETFKNGNGETFDSMSPAGVCVDRVGSLVVQCTASFSNAAEDAGLLLLRSYDDAATVTGIPAADREIRMGSDGELGGIAYDRDNDRLFVVIDDRVLIFEGAALAQSGNVAPTRFFSNPDIFGSSIALGPNGDLYVTGGSQTVLVFSNAGLRSGTATPDRTIFLLGFSNETVFVDSLDRLYVTEFDEIAVLDNASTLDGEIEFESFRVIQLQSLGGPGRVQFSITGLAVDSRGIGYVAVGDTGQIHIIDNIGTRSDEIRANRAIFGPAVEFGDADAIFLWE